MRCEAVVGVLSSYMDGRLAGKALEEVRAHLAGCPECSKAVHQLELVRERVARAGREPVPDGFEPGLRQRLDAVDRRSRWGEGARSPRWLSALGAWSTGARVAAGVAAVLVVVMVAGGISRFTGVDRLEAPALRGDLEVREESAGLGGGGVGLDVGTARMAAMKAAPPAPGATATGAGSEASYAGAFDRKIITESSLSVEVEDFPSALERALRICEAAGGYIADTTTSADTARDGKLTRGSVIARVPAERFREVMADLEKLGRLRSKNIRGTDVTEEYVDLASRLRNWKEQEKQLLVILTRATKVGDVLAVQSELFRVREEIERLTGRISYLDHMTSMATIRLEMSEPKKAAFLDIDLGFGRAVRRAVGAFVAGVNAMIVFVGGALPFVVVGVVAWLAVARVRRARGV